MGQVYYQQQDLAQAATAYQAALAINPRALTPGMSSARCAGNWATCPRRRPLCKRPRVATQPWPRLFSPSAASTSTRARSPTPRSAIARR
ncbi:MAG: tetratricopeptide repeat protein [Anaerolineae bacterium]|nr:tetratricopeptide repeat protein [Anaerolineae bacterium]